MTVALRDVGVAIKGTPLLTGIDLVVEPGEWLSVIGPNGAGKSTLLRAIAGVIRSTGSIKVGDQPIVDLNARSRAKLVSWVPQSPTIPTGISLFDYVLLGRTPHLHPLASERRSDLDIVAQVLDELDLTRLAERKVETLSGGELQRAVIGRALAQQAPVILLDEPTSALDLGHQQDVLTLLDGLRAGGNRTIVTTMHDLTLAGAFADRLVMLTCGEIVAEGSASDVLTEAHLAKYYGADVSVSHHNGQVLVTPRLVRPS